MCRLLIFRAWVAAAITLAATTGAQAQIGNVLNKTKNAVKKEAPKAATQTAEQAVGETATEQATGVSTASISGSIGATEKEALAKLLDESKRTAPKVKELCDYQRDYSLIRDWFGKQASRQVEDVQTVESAKEFKAAIEARTRENCGIYCALFEVPAGYDPAKLTDDYNFDFRYAADRPKMKDRVKSANEAASGAGDKLVEELDNYQTVMGLAADLVPRGKIVKDRDNPLLMTITLDDLKQIAIGRCAVRYENGKPVFYDRFASTAIVPLSDELYQGALRKYDIVLTLLRAEGSDTQKDAYWLAGHVRGIISMAQKNSGAMKQSTPIPASQMNNAALNAEMLKAAQQKYPAMGMTKIIITESAWRPVQNALGQIIHRIINTKAIYKNGSDYMMVTLSFIQPYAGGGKYGATQAHGIGTDNAAVEFR
jgi:hypothetical protein